MIYTPYIIFYIIIAGIINWKYIKAFHNAIIQNSILLSVLILFLILLQIIPAIFMIMILFGWSL